MAAKPVPDGYQNVIPYLVVEGAPALIDFLKRVFNGTEVERINRDDGSVMHSEVRIGNAVVMLAEASEKWKPMPAMMYVYVPDVDEAYKRALAAGATSIAEPSDQFYGDRMGGVTDKVGNQWWIATNVENVPREEYPERMKRHGRA
jgi:uncharacterized glyoxalase superfamily protein PhnB